MTMLIIAHAFALAYKSIQIFVQIFLRWPKAIASVQIEDDGEQIFDLYTNAIALVRDLYPICQQGH